MSDRGYRCSKCDCFICSLQLSFPISISLVRITEKQVSSYLNEMKNFVANYILFDNNIRERVIVMSKVNNRAPSDIYYSESISGGLYSGLIETLNTALREIPAILSERIQTYTDCTHACTDR